MSHLASHPTLPPPPPGIPAHSWIMQWGQTFSRIWAELVQFVNALSVIDTLANRSAAPQVDAISFVATDTYQQYIGIMGVWTAVGRVGGTVMGAVPFVEISDADAPAANGARLYARDNGAGKTQLVVRFATGAIQVIATEP